MRQSTTCLTVMWKALAALCIGATLAFCCFGPACTGAGIRAQASPSGIDVAQKPCSDLFSALRDRASRGDLVLTEQGAFECSVDNGDVLVAWVSTGSPIGEGVVGVFDQNHKLCDWKRTRAIRECRGLFVAGVGQTILVVEQGTGSGQRVETLTLLDASCLDHNVWSDCVHSYTDGLEGRNVGHRIDHSIILVDLDHNGIDELIDVASARLGTDIERMFLANPEVDCTVFCFDSQSRKFLRRPNAGRLLVYPDPLTSVGQSARRNR